jgi:hypothetical protein
MVEKEIISNAKGTIPNVLCFIGPHKIQEILLGNGNDLLRHCYECLQTLTIYQGTHNQSINQPIIEQHFWQ